MILLEAWSAHILFQILVVFMFCFMANANINDFFLAFTGSKIRPRISGCIFVYPNVYRYCNNLIQKDHKKLENNDVRKLTSCENLRKQLDLKTFTKINECNASTCFGNYFKLLISSHDTFILLFFQILIPQHVQRLVPLFR